MLKRAKLVEEIRLTFATLAAYIKPGGSLNLTDINVHAEDFVCELLNLVHSWNLKNANQRRPNYPCLDLIDSEARLGIQVTSEPGSLKINRTLECLMKHGMSEHIDRLKLFLLIPRQKSYAVRSICPGVAFAWQADVLDFDSTLAAITKIDDSQLEAVHALVTTSVPATIFEPGIAKSESVILFWPPWPFEIRLGKRRLLLWSVVLFIIAVLVGWFLDFEMTVDEGSMVPTIQSEDNVPNSG